MSLLQPASFFGCPAKHRESLLLDCVIVYVVSKMPSPNTYFLRQRYMPLLFVEDVVRLVRYGHFELKSWKYNLPKE